MKKQAAADAAAAAKANGKKGDKGKAGGKAGVEKVDGKAPKTAEGAARGDKKAKPHKKAKDPVVRCRSIVASLPAATGQLRWYQFFRRGRGLRMCNSSSRVSG